MYNVAIKQTATTGFCYFAVDKPFAVGSTGKASTTDRATAKATLPCAVCPVFVVCPPGSTRLSDAMLCARYTAHGEVCGTRQITCVSLETRVISTSDIYLEKYVANCTSGILFNPCAAIMTS